MNRQLEREEDYLVQQLNRGEISLRDYNKQMRELHRDYQAAAEDAAVDMGESAVTERDQLRAEVARLTADALTAEGQAMELSARLAEQTAALQPFALVPLEQFGWQRKPDHPLMAWNDYKVFVRDVLAAITAMEDAK